MKKLIAVMAFAGVLSVPSVLLADANWYGSLRGGVEFGGGDDARFKDGGSRWGIKGSNEVSEGLSAVYRFEAKIDSATATQPAGDRLSYVGLSGGFGTLSMGRVGSAGGNSTGGMLDNSFHYGDSYTGFRTGNAISYSNSVGGVSVQLDAIMNPDKDSGNAIDETQLGLSMNLGDFGKLAVSHVNVEDTMKDGMVDINVRAGTYNDPTLTDGIANASTGLTWETVSTNAYFDSKTAKSLMLKHTIPGETEDDPRVEVQVMRVYHAKDDAPENNEKATMKGDKLVADACTTGCDASTYVWVSSVYEEATGTNDGVKKYTVETTDVTDTNLMTTGTAMVTNVTPGEKKSTIAAEFGLGGITAFLGYSQVESNKKGAKKDKITHYGIRGGLGESGVNFLVQARSEDLQGSNPMDADRNPYVVNMSKSLGDGATAYIEHGTSDAKDAKANTRIGMIVNF